MNKWTPMDKEFSIDTDLQIQRAQRALTLKPKAGHPARSSVLNSHVKEMTMKKSEAEKNIQTSLEIGSTLTSTV